MDSICLSVTPLCASAPWRAVEAPSRSACSREISYPMAVSFSGLVSSERRRKAQMRQVVRMAPDEERLTRRNPLDFPVEWEKSKPGRRMDITPQFSPLKTPLPPPLPYDPPPEDEEEENPQEQQEEEQDEENPEEQQEEE